MNSLIQDFKIEELVDKATFEKFGDNAWLFLDKTALITLQQLRNTFGPLTVNDWHWGGNFEYSGFRHPQCSIGAKLSQHKFGRAFDVKSTDFSAQEMQDYILAYPEKFPYITRMENAEHTKKWLHFDVALTNENNIVIFGDHS